MTLDAVMQAYNTANAQAFLRLIRAGETNETDDAYRTVFGGGLFDAPPWAHPKSAVTKGATTSTAAGAYQFLATTWNGLVKRYGFADFSPQCQDLGALALIGEHGALDLVMAGDAAGAIAKCNTTWASLPGSPYGQPTRALAQALTTYQQYGGTTSQPTGAGSAPQTKVAETPQGVSPMPVFMALLPTIISLIPALGSLFSSGSAVAQRNIAAASIVSDALVKATNSPNIQAAVESMQNDTTVLQAARDAAHALIPTLMEAGSGGIGGARTAAAAGAGDWKRVVFSFPFLLCLFLMPLIYFVVVAALVKASWIVDLPSDTRTMIVTAVINLILGSIIGFVYGTSMGSQKKDDTIAAATGASS